MTPKEIIARVLMDSASSWRQGMSPSEPIHRAILTALTQAGYVIVPIGNVTAQQDIERILMENPGCNPLAGEAGDMYRAMISAYEGEAK